MGWAPPSSHFNQHPRIQSQNPLPTIVKAYRVQVHLADLREVVHEQGNFHENVGRRMKVRLPHSPEAAEYTFSGKLFEHFQCRIGIDWSKTHTHVSHYLDHDPPQAGEHNRAKGRVSFSTDHKFP